MDPTTRMRWYETRLHELSMIQRIGLIVFVLCAGCAETGGTGEQCKSTGILGPWECNVGLVCNDSVSPPICEKPHARSFGDHCSGQINCADGWCGHPENVCRPFVEAGGPCPGGIECMPELVCVKILDAATTRCELGDDAGAE
jgi:hypothetical protein